jgi:pentatricopeptide repeat protein
VSYDVLISAQCAAGQWQRALHTLTQMRDDSVAPAASSYQPLLLLCERRVQWQLALQVRACESLRSLFELCFCAAELSSKGVRRPPSCTYP